MPSTSIRHYFAIFAILSAVGIAAGTHKCVWVRGALQCQRDASKQLNVEVRVYDRDGFSIFKAFDPDDLMGVTFTEADGTFQLDGCGDDFNWLPGLQNLPDPYIRIHHYCNGEHGETIELPEFDTFVPETYDLGIIVLDSKKQPNVSVAFPPFTNPRHRVQSSSTETGKKSGEEVKIFDVLDSKEEEKMKKSSKSANEQIIPVTRPDDNSNWEIPVELAADSNESIEQVEEGKKSNERRPNWTKQKDGQEE